MAQNVWWHRGTTLAAVTAALTLVAAAPRTALADPDATAGNRIAAPHACYVRLPDLPSERYGGFGAFNGATGVLAYAGGAEKLAGDITLTHGDLFAVRLDGAATGWETLPSGNAGFMRANDRGCREMASVRVADDRWASVFGKDGCDNGRLAGIDQKGGDIKELTIGAQASPAGVRWVPNSGVAELIDPLARNFGQLSRPFAVWDARRDRIVFGQGTVDSGTDQDTRFEVLAAMPVGSKFQLKRLRPAAPAGDPGRRYGACAAYVHQPDTGADGVVVFGGRLGDTTFADVWWLDFGPNNDGTWVDLTPRIVNMGDFGARREGACAYDAASKMFYAWMGRVDSDVPDGASRSSGAWRLDLDRVADPAAPLAWERLAPDNTKGLTGRHLIPSVWDAANRRMLVVGGRKSEDTFRDVWAIYPDVTGEACDALDPYAPYRPTVPAPTPTATAPNPPAAGNLAPRLCPFLRSKVPPAVLSQALSNPHAVQGFGALQFPNLPAGPQNPRRVHLGLRNPGLAWDALFNGLIYRAGCS